jgi:polysaccharide biosynthesis protein PslH
LSARVLVVAGESPLPPNSGFRQRLLHLTRALASHFDVDLAVLGDYPPARERYGTYAIPHTVPRTAALLASLWQPYQAAKVRSRALARLAAREQWTSVHVELPFLARVVPLHVPLVLDAQNVESDVLRTLASQERRPLHRARWRWEAAKTERLEREVVRRAAAVCATSDDDAQRLERLGATRVLVVANGVDCAAVAHAPPAASSELVYVGHFGYRPNVLAALELVDEVLPRVRAHVPQASVTLVGRTPPRELVQLRGPHVTVAADVADVLPYLRRARALVVPLRSGGGTRLKVLEALAAGTAVVSTAFGTSGLDVRDGAHVLLGDSPQQLADHVVHLLRDDAAAAALSAAGRKLVVRRYDWSVVARPLVELHAELGAGA